MKTTVPEFPPSKNMLLNSSFDTASVPDWPDTWWLWNNSGTHRVLIGDPGGCGLDEEIKYHGKYALRIVGADEVDYRHQFTSAGMRGGILVEPGKPYTFSIYMRSDRPGATANLTLCNFAYNSANAEEGATERVTLTPEWRRYSVTVTRPETGWSPGIRPEMTIIIRTTSPHTFWFDAAQLEQAAAPTQYVQDHFITVPAPDYGQ